MVNQFPSPRILDTATAQPITFSYHRFLTYSTNEKLFGQLKAQWVTTIFPQNKLCNAWPFSLHYSFFHSNFLIFILILFLILVLILIFFLSMGSSYMYVPSALDQWTTRGAHVLGDQESILSFFLTPVVASRWLGVYEC